jgi:hypothetical protein
MQIHDIDVDFYIPSKQWSVELLRNGDRLKQYPGRFCQSGSYALSVQLHQSPRVPHLRRRILFHYPLCRLPNISSDSEIPKLHHVVFSDNFRNIYILDN